MSEALRVMLGVELPEIDDGLGETRVLSDKIIISFNDDKAT